MGGGCQWCAELARSPSAHAVACARDAVRLCLRCHRRLPAHGRQGLDGLEHFARCAAGRAVRVVAAGPHGCTGQCLCGVCRAGRAAAARRCGGTGPRAAARRQQAQPAAAGPAGVADGGQCDFPRGSPGLDSGATPARLARRPGAGGDDRMRDGWPRGAGLYRRCHAWPALAGAAPRLTAGPGRHCTGLVPVGLVPGQCRRPWPASRIWPCNGSGSPG
jgi:hypothetical protein